MLLVPRLYSVFFQEVLLMNCKLYLKVSGHHSYLFLLNISYKTIRGQTIKPTGTKKKQNKKQRRKTHNTLKELGMVSVTTPKKIENI